MPGMLTMPLLTTEEKLKFMLSLENCLSRRTHSTNLTCSPVPFQKVRHHSADTQ